MQLNPRLLVIWPVLLNVFVGCSIVAGRSGNQCDSDEDCRSYGADFSSTRCSLERVCVNVTVPELPDGGGSTCATNADCSAALGGPARCVQATCVSLMSEDCSLVPGSDYQRDNAIYVGVLGPFQGENVSYGANYVNAAYTAANALNTKTLDVSNARPVVVIGCNEVANPVRATNFLLGKVGAIVGPMSDGAFEQVLPVTKQAGIPLLAPLHDDPKYATVPNTDGLTWSCSPNRVDAVPAWNSALQAISDKVLAEQSATVLKVFLAATREPSSQSFATALESTLTFNDGKSTSDNGSNYTRADYAFDPNAAPDLATITGQILLVRPMVVLLPSLFGAAPLINAIEDGWGSGARPYYLVHRNDPKISRDVSRLEATERRHRIFALEWSRPDFVRANSAAFAGAFASLNNLPPAFLSETVFDCTFEYLYGAYASVGRAGSSVESLKGASFLSGVTLLSTPTDASNTKNVGTNDARSITDTLLNTQSPVRVQGASTDLAFDTSLGAPHADVDLYCIDKTSGAWRASGITYSRTTGGSSGTLDCP